MRLQHNSTIAIATSLVIAAASFFVTEASAGKFRQLQKTPPPSGFGLTTIPNRGPLAREPEHCNNAASCNIMIAYCIGNGGDFEVNGSGAGGRPTKGTCTY